MSLGSITGTVAPFAQNSLATNYGIPLAQPFQMVNPFNLSCL